MQQLTVNCDMFIELSGQDKGLNAHADGEKIVINAAMVDFTREEDEQLAFVLAHEYVHHMMGHVDSAKQNVMFGSLAGVIADAVAASQGMSTGGNFGKLARASRAAAIFAQLRARGRLYRALYARARRF